MQYACIVVNSKTKQLNQKFTYIIKPDQLPDIKPGILVLVPFGRKKIEGIIWNIKKYEQEAIRSKLKPIDKIIDPSVIFSTQQRSLAEKISRYYFSPLGEIVFSMIPPIARRIKLPITTNSVIKNSPGQTYTLYNSYLNRIENYLKLAIKATNQNKQVLILVPNLKQSDYLINTFRAKYKTKLLVYDTNTTKTKRYKNWIDIKTNKFSIVIGTRSAIFSPLANLGLIILDQPDSFSYKEEQSPRYNCQTIAKLIGVNLILGSNFPSVEEYYQLKKQHYKNIKPKNKQLTQPQIFLVDKSKAKSILSWDLENKISTALQQNKKTLLFVGRKGLNSAVICNDCKHLFTCPQCSAPLVMYGNNHLKCLKCLQKPKFSLVCPTCRGTNIVGLGHGTEKIKQITNKLFPQAKVMIIDDDNLIRPTDYEKTSIIIGTKKIFNYPWMKFDLVGIISIDNVLNLPNYNSTAEALNIVNNLLAINTSELIIQTNNPDKAFFQKLITNREQIWSEELKLRQAAFYPPFSRLVKLIYSDTNSKKASETINKIYRKLAFLNKLDAIKISEPTPCWIEKIKGKYRQQIVMRLSISHTPPELYSIIESLPQGTSVDADPLSLL